MVNQLGPLDSSLDRGMPFDPIEIQDSVEPPHVEQESVTAELLAAHRMPTPGHAHRMTFLLGVSQGRLNIID
jgi:hypothetical protein